jgi:hypothetical protein
MSTGHKRRRSHEEADDDTHVVIGRTSSSAASSGMCDSSVPDSSANSLAVWNGDVEEESGEEEEIIELSSNQFLNVAAKHIPATSSAVNDDDEVTILDGPKSTPPPPAVMSMTSTVPSTAAPPPKRKRIMLQSARPPTPRSPVAPPLEPLSPPQSPEAPPGSPVVAGRQLSSNAHQDQSDASAEVREELALRRAKAARTGQRGSPVAVARADGIRQPNIAAAASPSPPALAISQIRRRKTPTSSTPSALASASLEESYNTSVGIVTSSSRVSPELIWHHDNSVLCPSNPADRIDIERTFLQQVLVWDPFTITVAPSAAAAAAGKKASDVPREMQAFTKFLDPSVPLPIHFTSSIAYLGYFAPIVLDNFRAQMAQAVSLNLGELQIPRLSGKGDVAVSSVTADVTGMYAPMVPVLVAHAERHRSCWIATQLAPCSSINGGGDDWFDLRLRLTQHHRSLNDIMSSDLLVLGVDEATMDSNVKSTTTGGIGGSTPLLSEPTNPTQPIPPPSSSTLYVFAYLDGIHVEQAGSANLCILQFVWTLVFACLFTQFCCSITWLLLFIVPVRLLVFVYIFLE